MKKVTALFLLLACMLAGCGQKETVQEVIPTPAQEVTPTQEAEIILITQTSDGDVPSPTLVSGKETENGVFRYEESMYTECFAVDEDGLLYTITGFYKYTSQTIKIHDWDGNCIEEHELEIGTGKARHLLLKENHLYLLVPESDCANVLYQIDMTTWEAKRLYDFTEFEAVFDMMFLGDTMYVLGKYESVEEKEFCDYQDWYDKTNAKTSVVAYLHVNEETPELAYVPFDLPMYIFAVNEETLGIYGYEEKYIYRLFAYSPEENTLQAISASYSTSELISWRPFQYYEDRIFMILGSGDVYYVSMDGTEHEILRTNNHFYVRYSSLPELYNKKVIYASGCLFYQEFYSGNIGRNYMERVNIKDKLEKILQSE